jgi:hypothetical protein
MQINEKFEPEEDLRILLNDVIDSTKIKNENEVGNIFASTVFSSTQTPTSELHPKNKFPLSYHQKISLSQSCTCQHHLKSTNCLLKAKTLLQSIK